VGFIFLSVILLLVAVSSVWASKLVPATLVTKDRFGGPITETPNPVRRMVRIGGIVVPVALILLFGAFKSFHTVDNGHIGIVKQFGEVVDTTGDGFVTTMPWQNLHEVSVKREVRKYNMTNSGENLIGSAVSKDSQPIFIELVVDYSLDRTKAVELYKETGGEYVERLLDPAVPQLTKEVTSQYKATEVAGKRGEIRTKIVESLEREMEVLGILINQVSIPQFSPTRELSKAIEETVVAGQQAQRAEAQVAIKEAEARQVAAAAKGEADANRARAIGEADAIKLKAQADAYATRVKGQALRNNPSVLTLESINKLNPQVQLIVPEDSTLVQGLNGKTVVTP
jgi:regulator of protease activity HflC (stomatin/prohibitin superfamily)